MGIKFQILKFQHSNQLSKDAQLLTCQQRGRVRRPRRDRAAAQPHRLLSTPGKNIHSKVKANRYLIHKVWYIRWTWLNLGLAAT